VTYKVYLAAPYAARDGLRPFADELAVIGMECTSGWLLSDSDIVAGSGAASEQPIEQIRSEAWADLRAVGASDCIVQFTALAIESLRIPGASGPGLHSGGRQVELGYALSQSHKRRIVIGHPENIFQRALCEVVQDWHGAVLALVAYEREKNAASSLDVAVGG
jgi:hypothetical protein